MMNSKARLLSPAIALIAGFVLAAPVLADQVVYFVNGKAITVKKVEKGDRITILEVEGGGRIGIPSEQIDRIEDLVLSNPAPAVAAPPPPLLPAGGIGPQAQAAPVTAPAVATTTAAASPAPGAGAPVGPMIGGKPTQPGGGLAGLQPLAVGGADPDGPLKASSATMAPAGARGAGQITGPGVATRRFNARGNPYTRMRPPSVNYVQPGQGSVPGAPGASRSAGAPAAGGPAAAGTPAAAGNQPATTTAPPPPPPAPEPPAPQPDPPTADPAPDSQGDADTPAEPPADEPPADDGGSEN